MSKIIIKSSRKVVSFLLFFMMIISASFVIPSQKVQADYVNLQFSFKSVAQYWVVPYSTTYTITAAGGAGGNDPSNKSGGKGAVVSGTFSLTKGQTICIVTGGKGQTGSAYYSIAGGGGGGSFVVNTSTGTPLLVAGGGGGGSWFGAGGDATVGTPGSGNGGSGGSGGFSPTDGGGGGGYLTAGGNGTYGGKGGGSYQSGLPSGGAGSNGTNNGGFGGGGGGGQYAGSNNGWNDGAEGGGGGGGYTGGYGNSHGYGGGGGTSYNGGSSQSNIPGNNTGDGYVTIASTANIPVNTVYQNFTGFNYVNSWSVPYTGTYTIIAAGGVGGSDGYYYGGKGAIVSGNFSLIKGQTINIVTGGKGTGSGYYCGGGGGASYVYNATTGTLLLTAGGGGGAGMFSGGGDATAGTPGSGNGGSGGSGGFYGTDGGGGGGYLTAGGNGTSGGKGGGSYQSGFPTGGAGAGSNSGGYGGGGGGGEYYGANNGWNDGEGGGGGGGGYTGGYGSSHGGGGGGGTSYNAGSNQVNETAGNYSGDGYVSILGEFAIDITPPTVGSISNPGNVDFGAGSYDVYAYGVTDDVGVTSVKFPTWTQYNGQDDLIWYDGINLGGGTWKVTIPFNQHNNETGTYITHVYAYDAAGNYVFGGQALANVLPTYDAAIVSDTIPTSIKAGSTQSVSITVKNTGFNTWSSANNYKLGAVGDSDPFAAARQLISGGTTVATGQQYTFTFNMTAPMTPGNYVTDWRMLREYITWFGGTLTKSVTVQDATPPTVTFNPTNGSSIYTTTQVTITASDVDDTVSALYYKWDTNSYTGIVGGTTNVTPPSTGSHTLYAYAVDSNGNTSTAVSAAYTVNIQVTLNKPTLFGSGYYDENAQLSASGTNIADAAYRIFYTTNPTAPAISSGDNPGSGWTDTGVSNPAAVSNGSSILEVISGVYFHTPYTYITVKVWAESSTGDSAIDYTAAYSLKYDPNNVDSYIGSVAHNQIINTGQVISNPNDVANNVYIDGDYVRYRLELDVVNAALIKDMEITLDCNLYNDPDIQLQLDSIVLEKGTENPPGSGQYTYAVIKDFSGIAADGPAGGTNRYVFLLGNDNGGIPIIEANGAGRFAIAYGGRLRVNYNKTITSTVMRNDAQIKIYTGSVYPDPIAQDRPNRKFYMDTNISKLVIKYA